MPARDSAVGIQPSSSAEMASAITGMTTPVSAARAAPWRWASLNYITKAATEPATARYSRLSR